jgi:hypothetical protein
MSRMPGYFSSAAVIILIHTASICSSTLRNVSSAEIGVGVGIRIRLMVMFRLPSDVGDARRVASLHALDHPELVEFRDRPRRAAQRSRKVDPRVLRS